MRFSKKTTNWKVGIFEVENLTFSVSDDIISAVIIDDT